MKTLIDPSQVKDDLCLYIVGEKGNGKSTLVGRLALDGRQSDEPYLARRRYTLINKPSHLDMRRINLAIIVVDARIGFRLQTQKQIYQACDTHVPYIVVAINKMDKIAYDWSIYEDIFCQCDASFHQIERANVSYVPISALSGDMVVSRGVSMPWYNGPTLFELLESLDTEKLSGEIVDVGNQIIQSEFA